MFKAPRVFLYRTIQGCSKPGGTSYIGLYGVFKAPRVFLYRTIKGCSKPGGTSYIGLYRDAPPKRGNVFRLEACKMVGASL